MTDKIQIGKQRQKAPVIGGHRDQPPTASSTPLPSPVTAHALGQSFGATQALQQTGPQVANNEQPSSDPLQPAEGQVDTSSSPFLPNYADQEKPGWQNDGGVADWAKQEYQRESRKTLICSMTSDGKIGSVYFSGDEGRIRTTHSAGPAHEPHHGATTLQFNIAEDSAIAAFAKTHPQFVQFDKNGELDDINWDEYDYWLISKLENATVTTVPAWATVVDSPDTAYDPQQGSVPEDLKLFEIFKNINGKVESWHPSRGAATKFETDKQTLSVLYAAIKHINAQGITDPQARNKEFYEFIKSRLPNSAIIKQIRDPGAIK